MEPRTFDLIVIGGGPAGTSGALTAAVFGKRVALIEATGALGGAGVNTGTIPSKTLRESALLMSGWRARKLLGIELSVRDEAPLSEFMHHERYVTNALRELVEQRCRDHRVETVHGHARFLDANTVAVDAPAGTGAGKPGAPATFGAPTILIATGSSPARPKEFPFEHTRVHDSDEILSIAEMPRSLAVIGAGVIGAEYACTFAALGVEVHLVDGRESLLSFLDEQVSKALYEAMLASGIRFHFKERVQRCDAPPSGPITLTLTNSTLTVTDVLVAAGRQSNTGKLELAAAGLQASERGLLLVDEYYRTPVPSIYAAGDVIGAPALASTSMEQARVAICHAFGLLDKSAPSLQPAGIYTIPETSMVGETEQSLREKSIPYVVGRAHYSQNARGRIIGDEQGFLKLLFSQPDMRLVGVHAIGEQATELVNIGLIAMLTNADANLFSRACFNYPTLGDLYKSATYDAMLSRLCPPTAGTEDDL